MYTLRATSAFHPNHGLRNLQGVQTRFFGGGEGVQLGGNKYWRPELAAGGNKYLLLAVSGNKRLL